MSAACKKKAGFSGYLSLRWQQKCSLKLSWLFINSLTSYSIIILFPHQIKLSYVMPETLSIMDHTLALFLRIGPRRVNDE